MIEPLDEYDGLSAAVEPTTGEACWWEVPRLAVDGVSIVLRQSSQYYTDSLNSVLLDQASAHAAQRVTVPEHGILMWVPASSPTDALNGQVRSRPGALQEHVAGLVQRYAAEMIASLTAYAYLVEAMYALRF